jgi:hypothetical protein
MTAQSHWTQLDPKERFKKESFCARKKFVRFIRRVLVGAPRFELGTPSPPDR